MRLALLFGRAGGFRPDRYSFTERRRRQFDRQTSPAGRWWAAQPPLARLVYFLVIAAVALLGGSMTWLLGGAAGLWR